MAWDCGLIIYFYCQFLPIGYLTGSRIHRASTGTLVENTCAFRTCPSLSLSNMPSCAFHLLHCPKQLLVSTLLFPMILSAGTRPSTLFKKRKLMGEWECSPGCALGPTYIYIYERSWVSWLSPPIVCLLHWSPPCREGWQQLQVLLTRVEEEENEWCLLLARVRLYYVSMQKASPHLEFLDNVLLMYYLTFFSNITVWAAGTRSLTGCAIRFLSVWLL